MGVGVGRLITLLEEYNKRKQTKKLTRAIMGTAGPLCYNTDHFIFMIAN